MSLVREIFYKGKLNSHVSFRECTRQIRAVMDPNAPLSRVREWYCQAYPDDRKAAYACYDQAQMAKKVAYKLQRLNYKFNNEVMTGKLIKLTEAWESQPLNKLSLIHI